MIIEKANRLQHIDEYYFSTKLKEIKELQNQGKPIINLGVGSPDLAPPKKVIKEILAVISKDNSHSYQSYQGLLELRKAIAYFYQFHYQVSLNSDNEILPLMGSKEGIMHISMAFLNKNDQVLVPNPGYITYTSATKMVGAKPVFYDLAEKNNWLPNLEALEKKDLSKVKIMWLNYPNMPTGAVANIPFYKRLIAFAVKHKILLVNDNPYSFVLNQKPLSILSVKGAKNVAIELNSLSKTFNMAGWRVGMVLGKASYINTILQVKSNMDSGMFYGIQKGAIIALKTTNNWFNELNFIYNKRRKIVWKILDSLNCTYTKNSVGLFVWAKIPITETDFGLTEKLLHSKDIFITPGTIFGSNGKGYIRVSLCINEDKLKEVYQRLNFKK